MRIAVIGYGKMGRLIEEMALKRGHEVVLKITSSNRSELNRESANGADVAIEFTTPETAFENVITCIDLGLPVVCGSTGWNSKLTEAKQYCISHGGALLYSSNFSVGVNIFFEINKKLAALMNGQPAYDVVVKEIHHTQKKDKPSGTAVTIAEQIVEQIDRKKGWSLSGNTAADEIQIISERSDPAPGTHHVLYQSDIDNIEIIHTAHNRQGFAFGAVLAAEFLAAKKGVFQMSDVLVL